MYEVERLLALNNDLGESPLWNGTEQALYWIDHTNACFFRFTPATGSHETFRLADKPGCLAFHYSGQLILATTRGIGLWNKGQLTYLDNDVYQPTTRFNDGAADRQGRFWAGTASDDPTNHLYRLDLDGKVRIMESGIGISNGIGWSPDNKTMYYSDSGGEGVIYAYDFDPASGSIANRRVFVPPTSLRAVADGLTVDSEGCIWTAFWDGWRVSRYDPDGKLIAEIPMPVQRPTSCMFGGEDLTELYVTSSAGGLDLKHQPQAGDLFRVKTEVKGLPEPLVGLELGTLKFV